MIGWSPPLDLLEILVRLKLIRWKLYYRMLWAKIYFSLLDCILYVNIFVHILCEKKIKFL